jgi:hypothetical protein
LVVGVCTIGRTHSIRYPDMFMTYPKAFMISLYLSFIFQGFSLECFLYAVQGRCKDGARKAS